jgi:hypothetical protein
MAHVGAGVVHATFRVTDKDAAILGVRAAGIRQD